MQEEENIEKYSELEDIINDDIYYETYFGTDTEYYMKRSKKILNGKLFVFNFYAFFFGSLWLLYRKMYVEAVVFLLITIALDVFNYFVFDSDKITQWIIKITWSIILGCYANIYYIKKTQRMVERAKEAYSNTSERLDYLEKEGGVSLIAPAILIGIMVILTIVGIFFYDYIAEYL